MKSPKTFVETRLEILGSPALQHIFSKAVHFKQKLANESLAYIHGISRVHPYIHGSSAVRTRNVDLRRCLLGVFYVLLIVEETIVKKKPP